MAENIYRLFGLDLGPNRGQTPMGDFLLRLINENYSNLKEKYPFLRYINVFNRSDLAKHNRYNVQVYIDFIHDNGVTNDRNQIQIGKPKGSTKQPPLSVNTTHGAQAIYTRDSITIGKVFHSEEIFGESFEYVLDSRWNRILSDNPYYEVCSDFKKKVSPSFQQSPKMEKTLGSIKKEIDKIHKGEQKLEKKSEEFQNYYNLINDAKDPSIKFDELFKQWLSNLRFCYSNDGETYNGTTHFFFFNGPNYYGDGNTESNLADLVIDGNVGLTISNEQEKNDARSFLLDFRKFITQASFNLLVEYMNERLTETAVRASIAQVMARNMSHNFGSHVLSNLIGDDVYDKLRDVAVKKDLEDFERFTSVSEWDNDVFKNDGKNRQLPFFFQYLKSRMDYLSEVTFGVSNLLTTKMMRSDVMKELDQVRILLNYISGVSNFKYSFKLQLPDNDIGVAFPSDVLGCQAFYNIIENIIRNTAKHSKNESNKTVVFTITIKDNFANEEGFKGIEGVDELYCVEIDNGVTEDNIDELVNGKKDKSGKIIIKGQNNRLNDSVLEGQNLRSSSLGLLEMEASAAFLRQIDLPEIESDDYTVDLDDKYYHEESKGKKRLNILKAFAVKENENDTKGHLGYRFFLQKPKEFLFVGDWKICEKEGEQEKAIRRQLLNCGIQFITAEKFCEAMEAEKAFAHQFLIYNHGISNEALDFLSKDNDCKTLLPLRRLKVEDQTEIEKHWMSEKDGTIDAKAVLQKLKEFAWEKFFKEKEFIHQLKNSSVQEFQILGQIDRTSDNQVVFLDHGNKITHDHAWIGYSQVNADTGDMIIVKGAKDINEKEIWIENLSSKTMGKLPLFNKYCHTQEENGHQKNGNQGSYEDLVNNYLGNICSENSRRLPIIQEIFEAYHNKVVVIDERVQKFAMENKEGSSQCADKMICCIDLHESTNVHIPRLPTTEEEEGDDVFSLDPTDFSSVKEKVKRFVEKHLTNDNNKPFVLIHYGVLERMFGGNTDDINEILKKWAENAKRVVVTSGRGSHSLDLPKSVCFLNLSSVLYAFNENRNKFIINNLLNQSRRKRNE